MLTGNGTSTRTQEGTYSSPKEEIQKPLWTPIPVLSVLVHGAWFLPEYTNLSHCGLSLANPVRWQPSLVGGIIVLSTRQSERQCSEVKELTGPSNVRAGPSAIYLPILTKQCSIVMLCFCSCLAQMCQAESPLHPLLPPSWAQLPLGGLHQESVRWTEQ